MTRKTKINTGEVLDLAPLDLFICQNCRGEFPFPPDGSNKVTCPKCNTVMDTSHFFLLTRKQRLWANKRDLGSYFEHAKPLHFSYVGNYRLVVRFRQAIFEMYNKQGEITLAQAVAMLVAFNADCEEGVLKLLGKGGGGLKRAYHQHNWLDSNKSDESLLWDWLTTKQIKGGPGRPTNSNTLVLLLDAVVLMFCPNAYIHFVRDALRLRSQEYRVDTNRASGRREAWDKFWKAKKAVEVTCRRMWMVWFNNNPEPPPGDWWERVARQHGLIG